MTESRKNLVWCISE